MSAGGCPLFKIFATNADRRGNHVHYYPTIKLLNIVTTILFDLWSNHLKVSMNQLKLIHYPFCGDEISQHRLNQRPAG